MTAGYTRRRFLCVTGATGTTVAVAGCLGNDDNDSDEGNGQTPKAGNQTDARNGEGGDDEEDAESDVTLDASILEPEGEVLMGDSDELGDEAGTRMFELEYALETENVDKVDVAISIDDGVVYELAGISPDNGVIDVNYRELIAETGEPGEYDLQLVVSTGEEMSTDSVPVTLQESPAEQLLQQLNYLPNDTVSETGEDDGLIDPSRILLNDVKLMREISSEEALQESYAGTVEGAHKDALGTEVIDWQAAQFGHSVDSVYIFGYNQGVDEEMEETFSEDGEPEVYKDIEIYDTGLGNSVDLFAFYDPEENVGVWSSEDMVKTIIDTLRGDRESLRGELGLEYEDEDGEIRLMGFLTDDKYIPTLAGNLSNPSHMGGFDAVTSSYDWQMPRFRENKPEYDTYHDHELTADQLAVTLGDTDYQVIERRDGLEQKEGIPRPGWYVENFNGT